MAETEANLEQATAHFEDALYLRDFSLESFESIARPDIYEGVVHLEQQSPVEQNIAAACHDHFPVVGLANPGAIAASRHIPYFGIPDDRWKHVVVSLIDYASKIIIQAGTFGTGTQLELGFIQHRERESATIILIPDEQDREESREFYDMMGGSMPAGDFDLEVGELRQKFAAMGFVVTYKEFSQIF